MSWWDEVSKIRLVDINAKLETDQLGIVNVKIENNSYNFFFDNPVAVKAFMDAPKTPELERAIHENSTKRLENVVSNPAQLSGSTRTEMVAATSATSALWAVPKKSDNT